MDASRFTRKPAWGLLAAGVIVLLGHGPVSGLLIGMGMAGLCVNAKTYRKRKRDLLKLLEEIGVYRLSNDEKAA